MIINLTRPDGSFLSKITMPFFQATSTKLPLDREVVNIGSARRPSVGGPVHLHAERRQHADLDQAEPILDARARVASGRATSTGVDIHWNLNEQTAFNQVKTSELDQGPLPAAEVQSVANQYGVNKTRFWAKPQNCTGLPRVEHGERPVQGQRRSCAGRSTAPSTGRTYSRAGRPVRGQPVDASSAARRAGVEPRAAVSRATPDLAQARQLAAGHFQDGKITVYYRASGTINQAQAQIVRQDLINLGFEPANITMKGFSGGNIYTAWGVAATMATSASRWAGAPTIPDPAGVVASAFSCLAARTSSRRGGAGSSRRHRGSSARSGSRLSASSTSPS